MTWSFFSSFECLLYVLGCWKVQFLLRFPVRIGNIVSIPTAVSISRFFDWSLHLSLDRSLAQSPLRYCSPDRSVGRLFACTRSDSHVCLSTRLSTRWFSRSLARVITHLSCSITGSLLCSLGLASLHRSWMSVDKHRLIGWYPVIWHNHPVSHFDHKIIYMTICVSLTAVRCSVLVDIQR